MITRNIERLPSCSRKNLPILSWQPLLTTQRKQPSSNYFPTSSVLFLLLPLCHQQQSPSVSKSHHHSLLLHSSRIHTSRIKSPSIQIQSIQKRHIGSAHNFDTYKFVQRLEAESFSREHAEAIMNSLSEVITER